MSVFVENLRIVRHISRSFFVGKLLDGDDRYVPLGRVGFAGDLLHGDGESDALEIVMMRRAGGLGWVDL